jgi:hypothetical protein
MKFYNLNNSIKQKISLERIVQLEFSSYNASIEIPVSQQSTEK